MTSHASSVTTMSLGTGPEQLPASPRLAPPEPSAAAQRSRLRPLEAAQCSLCGIALPLALLVPDGGQACADIRWYCKDSRSCTERWTAAGLPGHVGTPTVPDTAVKRTAEAAPDGAVAGQLGGIPKDATSAM
jgi:hypothetical protein